MTLEYFYKTGEVYRYVNYGDGPEQEWDGDEGYNFEFEIDSEEIKTALVWILKNKTKNNLRHKVRYPAKYPIVNGLKDLVDRKFTAAENEFIDTLLNEVLSSIEEDDNLEEFAEQYREEITSYYEDEAMESQND
jgi:hypothetical protein